MAETRPGNDVLWASMGDAAWESSLVVPCEPSVALSCSPPSTSTPDEEKGRRGEGQMVLMSVVGGRLVMIVVAVMVVSGRCDCGGYCNCSIGGGGMVVRGGGSSGRW